VRERDLRLPQTISAGAGPHQGDPAGGSKKTAIDYVQTKKKKGVGYSPYGAVLVQKARGTRKQSARRIVRGESFNTRAPMQ